MEVRFWGVRGSVAASGSHVARIGGNTACVEVTSGDHRIILDAGTGLRSLGDAMMKEGRAHHVTMLWSHLHWDHVQGFPFFTPAYVPTTQLTMYGPGPGGDVNLEGALSDQMTAPNFPVPMSVMGAKMDFRSALHGQRIEVGPFVIIPFELPHPQGCMGYRIEADGRAFVYATDVELSLEHLTKDTAAFFEGVDALCLDAQYTPDEYKGVGGPPKKGWGHSTMVDAALIASACNVKRLLLFHHDPAHSDDKVEMMAEEARCYFHDTEPAREGKRILLGDPTLIALRPVA